MFGKKEVVGKLGVVWDIAISKDAIGFLPDTELEGASTEQRTLDEGDRGGHGPKTGRSAIVGGGGGENREGWRKGIGEAMALKRAEAP